MNQRIHKYQEILKQKQIKNPNVSVWKSEGREWANLLL